jgi:polyisoprenoid-binding protein YceI
MTTWNFDPTHSNIGFSVRHLMISKVRGEFGKWTGTFEYDESDPTRSKLEIHIDAASIDTREAKRDEHLRSPDFFDVAAHPELVFVSSSVERDGGDDFVVHGDLTIHGVTRPVQLKVESLGQSKDPWGGQRAGFSAKTTLSRKEFGLHWNVALEAGGVVVGDKIEIAIEIEAVRAAEQSVA